MWLIYNSKINPPILLTCQDLAVSQKLSNMLEKAARKCVAAAEKPMFIFTHS